MGTQADSNGQVVRPHTHEPVDVSKFNEQTLLQRLTALEDRMAGSSDKINPPHAARIANPGCLGLFAFGYTTALLACTYTRWTSGGTRTEEYSYSYALFYGGLIQLLAGMWAMWARNTFAATAFSSYGGFWLGLGIHGILVSGGVFTGEEIEGMSTFLALWSVFTFCLFDQTFNINVALMLLFLFLTLAFALLAPGEAHPRVLKAGGYFAWAAAVMAFYTGLAELTNEVYRRTILPLGILNIATANEDYSGRRADTL